MSLSNGGVPADQSDSIRLIRFEQVEAEKAYLVYAAMKRAEVREATLPQVPLWNVLKALSFAVFLEAFEVRQ